MNILVLTTVAFIRATNATKTVPGRYGKHVHKANGMLLDEFL